MDVDPTTGVYYDNVRWYNPSTGGFLGPDPLGFAAGQSNFYVYCGNSPTTYTDPSGLCSDGTDSGTSASVSEFLPSGEDRRGACSDRHSNLDG